MVIYCIENMVNGKCYVGQTIDYNYRKCRHKSNLKHERHQNKHLQRAWNKYTPKNFRFFVLKRCSSRKELFEEERKWIEGLNLLCDKEGYNKESAQRKYKISERTRKKMSESAKQKTLTEEHKKKVLKNSPNRVEVHKYDKEGNYIDSYLSYRQAGREHNIPYQGILKCINGNQKSCAGFQWSLEKKNKIKKYTNNSSRARPVNQLTLNGKFIKSFDSCLAASKEVNGCGSCVSKCCRGKLNKHKGYKWEYKNE